MKYALLLIISMTLGACSMFGNNGDTKEPTFSQIMAETPYEIRNYDHIVMATTESSGDFKRSQNESFNRLFKYISGENAANQSVKMTAPVIMKDSGTKIPMTTPVLMNDKGNARVMSFVLPAEYTLETAPKPTNPLVKLEAMKNRKFAVVKFNGFFSESNFETQKSNLETWIKQKKLKPVGAAMRAGYNPPWTLPPFRRNEVLIPIE